MKTQILKWTLKSGSQLKDLPIEVLTPEEKAFIEELNRQRALIDEPTIRSIVQELRKLPNLTSNGIKELVKSISEASDIDNAQAQLLLQELKFEAQKKIIEKLALLKPTNPKDVKDLFDRLNELQHHSQNRLHTPINAKNWQALNNTFEDEMMLDIDWFKNNEVPFKKKVLYSAIATTNGGKTIIKSWFGFEFIKKGYNVLFLAQEEPYEDTIRRVYQSALGLSEDQYKALTKDGFEKVGTMYTEVAEKRGYGEFFVASWHGANPEDIHHQLKEYREQHNIQIDAVIIDYAKLIETNTPKKNAQEWERIGIIFKELKELAMNSNVAILTSIQLNRESSKRMMTKNTSPDIYDVAGAYEAVHHVNYAWTIMMRQINTEGLTLDYMDSDRTVGNYTLTVQKQKYGRLKRGDSAVFAWKADHTLHWIDGISLPWQNNEGSEEF